MWDQVSAIGTLVRVLMELMSPEDCMNGVLLWSHQFIGLVDTILKDFTAVGDVESTGKARCHVAPLSRYAVF